MRLSLMAAVLLLPHLCAAYPAPVENDWIVRDFRFHNGQTLPELHLHYRTIGDSTKPAILLLHGTGQTGALFLSPALAGELFDSSQPLDASRYFLILPDAIGHGGSSKPSDGLRAQFPEYDYADMIVANFRLLTEHLGVRHIRAIIGNSMGGMETWLFGEMYPGFMDALVPLASTPSAMAGRNWMMRRMVIDAIRNDPAWKGGMYAEQPQAFRAVQVFFAIATSGGAQALYNQFPDSAKADAELERRLAQPSSVDANDDLFQLLASADYDPAPRIDRIRARVLAINAADDERNPPELGVMEAAIRRIPNARFVLIPVGPDSRGHGTTANARLWKKDLAALLGELGL